MGSAGEFDGPSSATPIATRSLPSSRGETPSSGVDQQELWWMLVVKSLRSSRIGENIVEHRRSIPFLELDISTSLKSPEIMGKVVSFILEDLPTLVAKLA